MPEQYTKIRDLFDTPSVLNKMSNSLDGNPPATTKLLYTLYSDGRIEIDGSWYVETGASVMEGDALIDLNDPIFPKFTAPPTLFMMSVLAGGPLTFIALAQYQPITNTIIYRDSTDVATLSAPSNEMYIRGTIVPHTVAKLGLNFFGG